MAVPLVVSPLLSAGSDQGIVQVQAPGKAQLRDVNSQRAFGQRGEIDVETIPDPPAFRAKILDVQNVGQGHVAAAALAGELCLGNSGAAYFPHFGIGGDERGQQKQ